MKLLYEEVLVAAIGHALALAGSMTWEILWVLILGFALSAVVQAVVHKSMGGSPKAQPIHRHG